MSNFDLGRFKAGQMAKFLPEFGDASEFPKFSYRFTTINGEICFETTDGKVGSADLTYLKNNATMVRKYQDLINNYDPQDTWQVYAKTTGKWVTVKEPKFQDNYQWRLHPHNDIIKEYNNGKPVYVVRFQLDEEYPPKVVKSFHLDPDPTWNEKTQYTTSCI